MPFASCWFILLLKNLVVSKEDFLPLYRQDSFSIWSTPVVNSNTWNRFSTLGVQIHYALNKLIIKITNTWFLFISEKFNFRWNKRRNFRNQIHLRSPVLAILFRNQKNAACMYVNLKKVFWEATIFFLFQSGKYIFLQYLPLANSPYHLWTNSK